MCVGGGLSASGGQDLTWAYTSSRRPGYTTSGLVGRFMGLTGWKENSRLEAMHIPRPEMPVRMRGWGATAGLNSVAGGGGAQSCEKLRAAVIADAGVVAAVAAAKAAGSLKGDVADVVLPILRTMETRLDPGAPRVLAWGLRKLMRQVRPPARACRPRSPCTHTHTHTPPRPTLPRAQIYEGLVIDRPGLARVRACAAAADGPVILLPTHRSYMDFLIASYIFFAYAPRSLVHT